MNFIGKMTSIISTGLIQQKMDNLKPISSMKVWRHGGQLEAVKTPRPDLPNFRH